MVWHSNPEKMRLKYFLLVCSCFFLWQGPAVARPIWTDAYMAQKIAAGYGVFIIKLNYYKGKSGTDVTEQKTTSSLARLFMLPPGSDDNEKECDLMYQTGYFVCSGLPGDYIISRLTFFGAYGLMNSMRIFQKALMENKVKYLGDLDLVSYTNSLGRMKSPQPKMDFQFRPTEFLPNFNKNYPGSSPYLVNDPLWKAPLPTAPDPQNGTPKGFDPSTNSRAS